MLGALQARGRRTISHNIYKASPRGTPTIYLIKRPLNLFLENLTTHYLPNPDFGLTPQDMVKKFPYLAEGLGFPKKLSVSQTLKKVS